MHNTTYPHMPYSLVIAASEKVISINFVNIGCILSLRRRPYVQEKKDLMQKKKQKRSLFFEAVIGLLNLKKGFTDHSILRNTVSLLQRRPYCRDEKSKLHLNLKRKNCEISLYVAVFTTKQKFCRKNALILHINLKLVGEMILQDWF